MTLKHSATFTNISVGLLILAVSAGLVACNDKAPSAAAPAADAAASAAAQQNELKAREEELARREAEVAAKERELALARREADLAAQEKELARQRANDAAAAAAAAKKVAKKPAAAKPPVASTNHSPPPMPAKPRESRVQVPGGTPLTVALSSELSSKTARAGDPVEATVASNLMVNGRVVVPTGTRVTGTVTDVISGSHAIGAVPTLGLRFETIKLEDGQIIPITGELMEQGPSEKVRDTAKILGGAAAGAVLGHQVKTNNRGTVIGGLLGGAVGAIAAKNTGTEVQLAAGSTVTLTTGEPFTVVVHEDGPQ